MFHLFHNVSNCFFRSYFMYFYISYSLMLLINTAIAREFSTFIKMVLCYLQMHNKYKELQQDDGRLQFQAMLSTLVFIKSVRNSVYYVMWGKVFSDFCFILVFMIDEEDEDDGEDDEAEDGEHSKPKTRYMTVNNYAPMPGI